MRGFIKSKKLVLAVIFSFALLIVVLSFLYFNRVSTVRLPADISQQISGFQAYFPKNTSALPDSLKIDKKSVRYQNGVLFFTIVSEKDRSNIVVSQQPVPKEFSAQGGNFVGKDTIDTKNGKATISYVEGRTSAFMITNDQKTLVILNSNQAIQTDTIRMILSNLDAI